MNTRDQLRGSPIHPVGIQNSHPGGKAITFGILKQQGGIGDGGDIFNLLKSYSNPSVNSHSRDHSASW